MHTTSINDFLLHGEFLEAPFGMDKYQFIQKFGQSEALLTVSNDDPRITLLKYGITEFYFGEPSNYEILDGILFQPMTYPSDNLNWNIDLQWVRDELKYKDVIDILTKEGISFKEYEDEMDQSIIETKSQVRFYFYPDELPLEEWELNKFGRFLW